MEKGYEFLVDSREKQNITKAIVIRKKIPHRVTALASGDFALRQLKSPVKSVVGIERKSVADLVQSIQSKSLFSQCERLTMHYEIPYLMISGNLESYMVKMKRYNLKTNRSVVYGTIASISVRGGLQVMWFPDDNTLIDVAYRICEKVSEGKYGTGISHKPKYLEFSSKKALTMVPGVTIKIADKLFTRFKTLRAISNAEINQLTIVDGVGTKVAEKIHVHFNKEHK